MAKFSTLHDLALSLAKLYVMSGHFGLSHLAPVHVPCHFAEATVSGCLASDKALRVLDAGSMDVSKGRAVYLRTWPARTVAWHLLGEWGNVSADVECKRRGSLRAVASMLGGFWKKIGHLGD